MVAAAVRTMNDERVAVIEHVHRMNSCQRHVKASGVGVRRMWWPVSSSGCATPTAL